MQSGVRIDPATSVQLGANTWIAIVESLPRSMRTRIRKKSGAYQRFVEAAIWVAWADAHWAELPPECGAWRSVHARFLRWNRRGLWNVVAMHIGNEASAHLLRRAAGARQRSRPTLPLAARPIEPPQILHPVRSVAIVD
ncbi:transposase [Lysobacter sp. S4-A87]|uniref:transposase n=1 Tax=Lysobacter sp. S4-A87 TaxID=2925843 RepID=UPI001F535E5E|nr:transposase [Lysobacter sp. S4-A87]UNK47937.1 transposase [Lysobacter sp. S4-A87]